jgi:hypothetical protein
LYAYRDCQVTITCWSEPEAAGLSGASGGAGRVGVGHIGVVGRTVGRVVGRVVGRTRAEYGTSDTSCDHGPFVSWLQ